jgi:hypothetical protein
MSKTPNERQLAHAGEPLVLESLQLFDAYPGVGLKGMPTPPLKISQDGFTRWPRTTRDETIFQIDRTYNAHCLYTAIVFLLATTT